jgi:hypothetical protein
LAEFRAYYRAHARVRPGPERRLPNGAAWHLLFDVGTGMAAPRMTWMPDRTSTDRANRLLEAIHGLSLIEYADQAEQWPRQYAPPPVSQRRRYEEWVASPSRSDHFISQDEVAVTYATGKLVSYVELGKVAFQESYVPPWLEGWTLDLDRGVVFTIGPCPGSERYDMYGSPLFRFGDLLDVCDEASYGRLLGLQAAAAERAAIPEAEAKDHRSCNRGRCATSW